MSDQQDPFERLASHQSDGGLNDGAAVDSNKAVRDWWRTDHDPTAGRNQYPRRNGDWQSGGDRDSQADPSNPRYGHRFVQAAPSPASPSAASPSPSSSDDALPAWRQTGDSSAAPTQRRQPHASSVTENRLDVAPWRGPQADKRHGGFLPSQQQAGSAGRDAVAALNADRRRRTIRAMLVVLLVLAVFVGAGYIATIVLGKPTDLIDTYLADITAGDYGKAADLADPGLTDDQRLLLQDGILADDKRPSNIQTNDSTVRTTPFTYSVAVAYDIGDGRDYCVISLRTGWDGTWHFVDSLLGAIEVDPDSGFAINGKAVKNVDYHPSYKAVDGSTMKPYHDDDIVLPVYPGVYDVTSQLTPSKYFVATYSSYNLGSPQVQDVTDSETFTVLGRGQFIEWIYLDISPTGAAYDDAETALKTQVEKCVADANAEDTSDPFCGALLMYVEPDEKATFTLNGDITIGMEDLYGCELHVTQVTCWVDTPDDVTVSVAYTSLTGRRPSSPRYTRTLWSGSEVVLEGDSLTLA